MEKIIEKTLTAAKFEDLQNVIFCKCERGDQCLLHLWKIKPCKSSNFAAAKVFLIIFSRKYHFANYLEITLAGAKLWTLWCVIKIYLHSLDDCILCWIVVLQHLLYKHRLSGGMRHISHSSNSDNTHQNLSSLSRC